MKLLILGGTVFLGRHLTEAALAAGHDVTLFNRGQHNANLYPDLEKLRGDRDGGLDVLKGRTWDAVVDTCGYIPRLVRDSASLLSDAVDHYTFISTLSVYRDFRVRGLREEAPVGTLDDETVEEEVTAGSRGTYGPLKALCEQAAEAAMPGRVLCARPGLMVGPYDPTDRFTYWPVRVARGGQVLVPPTPQAPVQFIDARDLATWVMRMAEHNKTGVYNATGPAERLTFEGIVNLLGSISSPGNRGCISGSIPTDPALRPPALYP
jgi:2'-hydroxyisoflavone reductase